MNWMTALACMTLDTSPWVFSFQNLQDRFKSVKSKNISFLCWYSEVLSKLVYITLISFEEHTRTLVVAYTAAPKSILFYSPRKFFQNAIC